MSLHRIQLLVMQAGYNLGTVQFDYRYGSAITLNFDTTQVEIVMNRNERSWVNVGNAAPHFYDHATPEGETRFFVGNAMWLIQYKEIAP